MYAAIPLVGRGGFRANEACGGRGGGTVVVAVFLRAHDKLARGIARQNARRCFCRTGVRQTIPVALRVSNVRESTSGGANILDVTTWEAHSRCWEATA